MVDGQDAGLACIVMRRRSPSRLSGSDVTTSSGGEHALSEGQFDLRRFVLTYRELYDNVGAPATAGGSRANRMALSRSAPTRPVGDVR